MSKNPFDVLSSETNYAVGINRSAIKCLMTKQFSETLLPSTYIYAFNWNCKKFQKITYSHALGLIEQYEHNQGYSKDAEYSLKATKFTSEDGETVIRYTVVLHDKTHIIYGVKEFNRFLAETLNSFYKEKWGLFFSSFKETQEWFYQVYKRYADCTRRELEAVFDTLMGVAELVEEEVDNRVENGTIY